jgi:uncharacterized membrane protein YdjX (TVP38/TMEM64 family)
MGFIILILLVGVYFLTPVRQYFTLENVIRLVERIKDNPWAPLIFVGAYTASCVLWPLTIFPVAGGVLFGFWKGFFLNTIAANLGAWTTFFIARQFGRETVGKLMKGSFKTFDEQTTRHGLSAVFTFRMIAFPPFLVTNYASGLSGIRVKDYVVGTFLGMLAWTVVFTYFADTLWKAVMTSGTQGFQKAVGQFFWPVMGGFLVLTVIITLTIFLKKRSGFREAKTGG